MVGERGAGAVETRDGERRAEMDRGRWRGGVCISSVAMVATTAKMVVVVVVVVVVGGGRQQEQGWPGWSTKRPIPQGGGGASAVKG